MYEVLDLTFKLYLKSMSYFFYCFFFISFVILLFNLRIWWHKNWKKLSLVDNVDSPCSIEIIIPLSSKPVGRNMEIIENAWNTACEHGHQTQCWPIPGKILLRKHKTWYRLSSISNKKDSSFGHIMFWFLQLLLKF